MLFPTCLLYPLADLDMLFQGYIQWQKCLYQSKWLRKSLTLYRGISFLEIPLVKMIGETIVEVELRTTPIPVSLQRDCIKERSGKIVRKNGIVVDYIDNLTIGFLIDCDNTTTPIISFIHSICRLECSYRNAAGNANLLML